MSENADFHIAVERRSDKGAVLVDCSHKRRLRQLEIVRDTAGKTLAQPFAEPVCVVIAHRGVTDGEARGCLGDTLPLRVVTWEEEEYLSVILALRPRVIVVLGPAEELVCERAELIASLLSNFGPTVISVALSHTPHCGPDLLVHQLGMRTRVRITSLSDVALP